MFNIIKNNAQLTRLKHGRNKAFAFTLAEVLITLTIIGIVAALTIPIIINNVQDQQLLTGWKAGYSILNQATALAIKDNGGPFTTLGTITAMKDTLKPYFVYSKECPAVSKGFCWASNGKQPNGAPDGSTDVPALILNNGMFVRFYQHDNGTGCNQTSYYTTGECGAFEIDINGFKGPNIWGKDMFYVHILPTGIMAAGAPGSAGSMTDANCSTVGYGCGAARLLQ